MNNDCPPACRREKGWTLNCESILPGLSNYIFLFTACASKLPILITPRFAVVYDTGKNLLVYKMAVLFEGVSRRLSKEKGCGRNGHADRV